MIDDTGKDGQGKRVFPSSQVPRSQLEREIFARNLRTSRLEAKLSQRDLAQKTGIAQTHISQTENARWNLGIETMVKLAQAVRKPLYLLLKP